jgi:hypothetical protein
MSHLSQAFNISMGTLCVIVMGALTYIIVHEGYWLVHGQCILR